MDTVTPPESGGHTINWDDLVALPPYSSSRSAPIVGALDRAIAEIDAAVGRNGDTARRFVPSAGALYPYDVVITDPEFCSAAVLDPVTRKLRVPENTPLPTDVDHYGWMVIGRPWLSMRKYGRRGYLYHLLDIGHALVNLGMRSGRDPLSARLRERSVGLSEQLGGVPRAIGVIAPSASGAASGWVLDIADPAAPRTRNEFEQTAVAIAPDQSPEPLDLAGMRFDDTWPAVSPRRKSAPRFGAPGSVAEAEGCLDAAIASGRENLMRLNIAAPHLTMVGRAELDRYLPQDELSVALAGQRHLCGPDAVVVMSAEQPHQNCVDPDRQRMLLAAGVIGQSIYLEATARRLGVTGIGGIDPRAWRPLLPPGHVAFYVVAVGADIAAATEAKLDALTAEGHLRNRELTGSGVRR
ncbi:hypothetical protein GIY30_15695 [Gordonia sp. HNM0687]|uniref:Nitroreductase domain-containing protein n=1 Tax=Gordonia mangrovi TaxID=2665643 RepID=A0A6L7GVX2_9ACTN|nr:hypothetical protein [Gordonia mangrovi]MXP22785.1 hypothetical protein [Gordonia mangrovi]UVF77099.1 hypothetical protein NWF22_17495 [Gordonia mangrovi]